MGTTSTFPIEPQRSSLILGDLPSILDPNTIPHRTSSSRTNTTNTIGTAPHAPRKSSSSPPPNAAPRDPVENGSRASVTSVLSFGPSQSTITQAHVPTSFLASYAMTQQLPPPSPPDPNRFATDDFDFGARRSWSQDKERVVAGPFDYLHNHPGKNIRAQMIRAFDAWLEVPPESLAVITRVVGMLHTASLLVDDVEDNSLLRRGFPVAHSIFGVPQVINSSNYVYFVALQELQRLRNHDAIVIFSEEMVNLHRGQGMDLFWRDTLTCPTENDYLEMVANKTGGLFRLAVKLMQAESRSPLDCVPLVNVLGLIFQIQDDYRNLWSKQYTDNKGMCEDLTEGKFSFPVIHSVRSDPTNMQLLNILRQKTNDETVKRYAVTYMQKTGSFEYTRRVVAVLMARARKMVDELDCGRGAAEGIYKILDKLSMED